MAESKNRMTEGPIAGKIVRFALPLFLGNLFQQLYNTADTLIVGNLLGSNALAAVSSSGTLVYLLVGLFAGIAAGAGVVTARYFGARDTERLQIAIHTTLAFGLATGVFLTVIGTLLAPTILVWMDTPPEVMPQSVTYIRIYFAGSMSLVLFNVCMGIMQAVGDSKHPLYYLIISSLINIALDVALIAWFRFGVGAAAFATVLSQFVSVILCLVRLMRTREEYRVSLRKIRFDWDMLRQIIRYGLPSGLQNSITGLANVVVQSNINTFGEMAMAGCGAYSKIEGFAFLPITSFTMAITTFVGQNLGAEEYERTRRGARFGIFCSVVLAEVIGVAFFLSAPQLIAAFTDEPAAIAYGVEKARICSLFYAFLAYSHCISAVLRGAGRAAVPMAIMLTFWCGVRVTFLAVMVPLFQVIAVVNWVYPLTWSLSSLVFLIYYRKSDWLHGFQGETHRRVLKRK